MRIEGFSSNYPHSFGEKPEPPLVKQMEEFVTKIRGFIGEDPINFSAAKALAITIRAFLEKNDATLEKIVEANGWPLNGAFDWDAEYNSVMEQVGAFLEDPNEAGLIGLNEFMTQLTWLLMNKNTG